MSDDNELKSLSKDVNNALYSQDRASRVARELGYSSANKANKIVLEIREEMLANDTEVAFIQTGVEKEETTSLIATGVENTDGEIITSVEDETEKIIASVSSEANNSGQSTVEGANTVVQQGVNTVVEKASEMSEEVAEKATSKIATIATGVQKVIGISTKTAKIGAKGVNKTSRFVHNNVPTVDADGNIDSVGTSTNQVKTFAKFAGRNAVGKPVKKVTTKVAKKVGTKIAKKATTKLAKLEAKLTAKVAKMSSKLAVKIASFAIKLIIKIISLIIEAICACLPLAVILIVIIIIAVVCLMVFGGGMNDEELQKFGDYMNTVQAEFQEETLGYYNEGYKVDGTYNGVAVINWRAALSTLQSLDPDIDGSEDVFDFLRQMKSDGVMYTITQEQTEEYVYKTETITTTDENGDTKTETVEYKTTIKYVVYVGTLDDYKNWVSDNTSYIKSYYDKRGISYSSSTTNFLTDDLSECIDTLYNSEEFDMMLNEAGVTLSISGIADGTIYDTGANNGVLAYPTTYRTLSADFPTYPSGKSHTGIDFPCPSGTPVCACADGTVIVVKELNYSYGHYVVIQHEIDGRTIYTLYAHNSQLKVYQGQTVSKGQVIALSGSTGNSTGPHCHLSVLTSWSPQNYVDPKNYL